MMEISNVNLQAAVDVTIRYLHHKPKNSTSEEQEIERMEELADTKRCPLYAEVEEGESIYIHIYILCLLLCIIYIYIHTCIYIYIIHIYIYMSIGCRR